MEVLSFNAYGDVMDIKENLERGGLMVGFMAFLPLESAT